MTSDAQARPTAEKDESVPPAEAPMAGDEVSAAQDEADATTGSRDEREVENRAEKRARRTAAAEADENLAEQRSRRGPLVAVLAVLLVLLLGLVGFLWFTRAEASTVRTDSYVEALQAARSGIVDMTSFDHLTLDDDIEQIRRVSTGELRDEAVAELQDRREDILAAQAVVNTEIVGAGVVRADEEEATVMMIMQSTQQNAANPQAQLVRYRIEVELQKEDGRWLLSSITGTGSDE